MSRLLHAAARGARIDVFYQCKWVSAIAVRTVDDLYNYRIHPDDAHLQYGPISTALRNHALGLPLVETCWFSKLLLHTDGDLYTLSPNDRYVFFLLMAEALADEGL